jgi:hypothetical protein
MHLSGSLSIYIVYDRELRRESQSATPVIDWGIPGAPQTYQRQTTISTGHANIHNMYIATMYIPKVNT